MSHCVVADWMSRRTVDENVERPRVMGVAALESKTIV